MSLSQSPMPYDFVILLVNGLALLGCGGQVVLYTRESPRYLRNQKPKPGRSPRRMAPWYALLHFEVARTEPDLATKIC